MFDFNKFSLQLPSRDHSRVLLVFKNVKEHLELYLKNLTKSAAVETVLRDLCAKFDAIQVKFDSKIDYVNTAMQNVDLTKETNIRSATPTANYSAQ